MSSEDFESEMIKLRIRYRYDPEAFHTHADELMCNLLRTYGFGAGVDIFENTDKWYS